MTLLIYLPSILSIELFKICGNTLYCVYTYTKKNFNFHFVAQEYGILS